MKKDLWTRVKFRLYNLKLRIVFYFNNDSGRVIPTNDNTRCIGKTRLLCEKANKNYIPIITKYSTHYHLNRDILFKIVNKTHPNISLGAKRSRVFDLVYDINNIQYILGRFSVNQEVYVDEMLNTEDILILKEKFGLIIKNGFYYNNLLKSPLETKKKLWWK